MAIQTTQDASIIVGQREFLAFFRWDVSVLKNVVPDKPRQVERAMKMSMAKIKQQALNLENYDKRDVRTQFGALCWRSHNGKVQILLVTSKRSGRWIVPKGWPLDGATPAQTAVTEAWEEAGVTGKARTVCLGIYSYVKALPDSEKLPCVVAIFPLKVNSVAGEWPEKNRRKRKWVSPKKAAAMVQERELAGILLNFDPRDS